MELALVALVWLVCGVVAHAIAERRGQSSGLLTGLVLAPSASCSR